VGTHNPLQFSASNAA